MCRTENSDKSEFPLSAHVLAFAGGCAFIRLAATSTRAMHISGRTLSTMLTLNSRSLAADVLAAFSVALVLVPQALAYASLAGMPPAYGLYAATLPLLCAALFASSAYLQTGPVAMTSLLTLTALSPLAAPGSSDYVLLAPLLALVVGVLRVAVGLAHAGFFAYLLSQPALMGFSSGAALLICASQVPAMFGVQAAAAGANSSAIATVQWTLLQPALWHWGAMALCAFTIVLLLGGRRLHPLFPAVLIAVVAGVLATQLGFDAGPRVADVSVSWPPPTFTLPWAQLPHLLLPGLVIAFVGFAEPAAVARTLATQARTNWNADRELLAQGAANIASAAVGGFPVGGSFSRTTLARLAGARSRWCGAFVGLWVCAALPWVHWLHALPQAVLAGIVIASVVALVQLSPMVRLFALSRAQAVVAWGTFVLTIALSPRIDIAVLLGVLLGIAVHLWRERRIAVHAEYNQRTDELRLEPVGVLYFGSAPVLDDALIVALSEHPAARRLVIDLRRLGRIDYTGAVVLQRVATDAEVAGLHVRIIPGLPLQGREILLRVFGAQQHWIDESESA